MSEVLPLTGYLDYAATAPVLPEVLASMEAHYPVAGNASSMHAYGRNSRRVVEEAREEIAAAVGCRPIEVVFTSGGTEANNLALKGLFWGQPTKSKIFASAVEHHAVLDPLHWLAESQGAAVELLPVDQNGCLDLAVFAEKLAAAADELAAVSVMWANNEVGTVQPMAEIMALAKQHQVLVHTDAVQAFGSVPISFADLAAMSITGHKLGGPFGIGALIVRTDVPIAPVLHGGGQERDIRSGTLPTPLVAGFATACRLAATAVTDRASRIRELSAQLVAGVLREIPDAVLNGPDQDSQRLPGVSHFSFPGCEGDALLMLLDARGIACSTGSACNAGVPQPSHVLLAMGRDEVTARSSLRFSLGNLTTAAEIESLLAVLPSAVARARSATGYQVSNQTGMRVVP